MCLSEIRLVEPCNEHLEGASRLIGEIHGAVALEEVTTEGFVQEVDFVADEVLVDDELFAFLSSVDGDEVGS